MQSTCCTKRLLSTNCKKTSNVDQTQRYKTPGHYRSEYSLRCSRDSAKSPPFLRLHPFSYVCIVFLFVAQKIPQIEAQVDDDDDYYASYEADEDDDEETVTDTRVALSRSERAADSNGSYYDFVITEYSYKLWAVFMIYDIICVFYACLVSTYFGLVNTLAPTVSYDYDYLAKRSAADLDEHVLKAPPHKDKATFVRMRRFVTSTPYPPVGDSGGRGRRNETVKNIKEKNKKAKK